MIDAAEVTAQLEKEGIKVEVPEIQEREFTPFEKEQMEKGWNPEGERTAEQYAFAEPLYKDLKKRGQEIKQLKRTIDEMAVLMKKQETAAYSKAMQELLQQRDEAIRRGNVDLVNQIDSERQKIVPPQPVTPPEPVLEFQKKYDYILTPSNTITAKIDRWVREEDTRLASEGLDPSDHMKELESRMTTKFKDFFNTDDEPARVQAVESGSNDNVMKTKSSSKIAFSDLSADQKQIGRDLVTAKVFKNMDDYIQELVKLGEVK